MVEPDPRAAQPGAYDAWMPATLELPQSRWAEVDGGPVHYREWAGPQRLTFVCVHGLGGSHLNWAAVAPGLARHGRVLALDLAGFGLTPPSTRLPRGVAGGWRLVDGFLRALALPPVVLVGNSMGGMITLIHAAHAPQTVRAMVLVDAAFPGVVSARGVTSPRVAAVFALYSWPAAARRFARARARRLGPEGLVRETLRIAAADPSLLDPALVEAHVEMARRRMDFDYAVDAFLAAARSIVNSQAFPGRYRDLVRRVGRPALVIHGGRDRLVPLAAARTAVRSHPDWTLVVFPDLGHIPQMEAPDRWLDAVEGWLEVARTPTRSG